MYKLEDGLICPLSSTCERCKQEHCAWWDYVHERCTIVSISKQK